jgi:hypothetical protein
MVPNEPTRMRSADLAQLIERQIVQRSWGRIHRLQVEVFDDLVIVHGYTQSYHSKQLALEGVLDVTDDSTRVELDIQVGSRPPSAIQSRAYDRVLRPAPRGSATSLTISGVEGGSLN